MERLRPLLPREAGVLTLLVGEALTPMEPRMISVFRAVGAWGLKVVWGLGFRVEELRF